GAKATGPLRHALHLPIVERVEQTVTLRVSRAGRNGGRERRFALRGPLVNIAGRWQIEPGEDGVRLRMTLDHEVAPSIGGHAANALASRAPRPIRTDADAILSRGVADFFETRLAEQAAAYCDALRTYLTDPPA